MKKLLASLVPLVSGVALFSLTVTSVFALITLFPDVVQTHANYVAINYLNTQGVMSGYSDGTFKPEQLVNRAEALKILLVGNNVKLPSEIQEEPFNDVAVSEWFAKYVSKAKELAIVNGNPDGTFAPARNVSRAEFVKMLLMANSFQAVNWLGQEIYDDVPADAWFSPYMNYAGQSGLVTKDDQNNLYPGKELTRAEVAEILYLMIVIKNGGDTQFLLSQAEAQMAQIDLYTSAGMPLLAKRASELSVDMTQQAYKNMPDNNVVLGAAKLARAYDFLVNAYIAALQEQKEEAVDWANQAIAKATEAWEVNNELQSLARHVKNGANEILDRMAA